MKELRKNFCASYCPIDHRCTRTGKECGIVKKYLDKSHVKLGWMETPFTDKYGIDWQVDELINKAEPTHADIIRNTVWEDCNATQQEIVLSMFTPRQKQVFLKSEEDFMTEDEIAKELNLHPRTIECHKKALRKNLEKLM